jgi:hypothetical protein
MSAYQRSYLSNFNSEDIQTGVGPADTRGISLDVMNFTNQRYVWKPMPGRVLGESLSAFLKVYVTQ